MNVLMVAATPFFSDRGSHIRIRHEMRHLAAAGDRVRLCTYAVGRDLPGLEVRRSIALPGYRKITPGASWLKPLLDFLLLATVFREAARRPPDVFHAHQHESLLAAFLVRAATFSRAPLILDCQGSLAEEFCRAHLRSRVLRLLVFPLFRIAERFMLCLPDHILCSSENSVAYLVDVLGVPRRKITRVADGIDAAPRVTDEERRRLRRELGIPDGNRVVVYAGSLNAAKGVDVLLDALPGLVRSNPKTTFLLLGYGDLEAVARKRFATEVSRGEVAFTGRVAYEDLGRHLAIADLAIDPKPATSEASGKIMEYLAAGLPVACFHAPGADLRGAVTLIRSLDEVTALLARGSRSPIPEDLRERYSWTALTREIRRSHGLRLS